MAHAPIVYLDTQDFSKFGDVLRGCGHDEISQVFNELELRKNDGRARFAVSMPILGELLQYSSVHRETTFKKAEAIERLCDGWALAYPSRLVAGEVANAITGTQPEVLCGDWYWYPNVSDVFDDLDRQMRDELGREVAAAHLPNRKARRGAAKLVRTSNPVTFAAEAAPAIAAKYGLPESAITGSIVAKLKGRITSEEASRRLFGSIARPAKFAETYFERMQNDRSLPRWMSDLGQSLQERLDRARETLIPLLSSTNERTWLSDAIDERTKGFGAALLGLAAEDLIEFSIAEDAYQNFTTDIEAAWQLPSCRTVGLILQAYLRQILGYAGPPARTERSFGGDLVHALYLPYVDLWRADRRFGALVKSVRPEMTLRVVTSLTELPAAIDALH